MCTLSFKFRRHVKWLFARFYRCISFFISSVSQQVKKRLSTQRFAFAKILRHQIIIIIIISIIAITMYIYEAPYIWTKSIHMRKYIGAKICSNILFID